MGAERADGSPPGAAEGTRDVRGDARGVAGEPPGAHGDVRGAVEEAYAVFTRHPLVARIEACPHRVGGEDQGRLRSAPLRELDADRLRDRRPRLEELLHALDDSSGDRDPAAVPSDAHARLEYL